MRHGTCVKCGATTVRAAANGVQIGERPWVQLRPHVGSDFRGILHTHRSDLWAYVCTTCGYVELHLIDPAGLEFVKEQWAEVPVTPRPG